MLPAGALALALGFAAPLYAQDQSAPPPHAQDRSAPPKPPRLDHPTAPKPAHTGPVRLTELTRAHPKHLAELIKEALKNHPAVQEAKHAWAAARERPSQAGSLPDPVLGVALQNIRTDEPALDTSPMSALQFSLTQTFPFPGQLSRREAVARAQADASKQRLGLVRIQIALRVERAYWRLEYAEAAERTTADSESLLSTVEKTVAAHYSVGHVAQQDALSAEVAHSRLRSVLEHRRLAVSAARRALNSAVGRTPRADIATADKPPGGRVGLDRVALLRDVKRRNPAINVRRAQLAAARRGVDEAKHDRWPGIQVGLAYRYRQASPGDLSNGADMFGVSIAVPIPVWMGSKQNARVRQSYDALGAARSGVSDQTLDAETRFERLADDVTQLNTQVALYQREILPETKHTVNASLSDYGVGSVGMVSVLDNWKTDLDARVTYAKLLSDRAIRVAEVYALAGRIP